MYKRQPELLLDRQDLGRERLVDLEEIDVAELPARAIARGAAKRAIGSACIGGGQGIAVLLEKV